MMDATDQPSAAQLAEAHRAQRGHRYLVYILAALVITELLSVAIAYFRFGVFITPRHVVRWPLTALLSYFLLRGHSWARWIFVFFFALAALLSLGMMLRFAPLDFPLRIPALVFSFLFFASSLLIACGLVWSESIQAYFRAHRAQASINAPAA